jgi:hypothetical protein
LHCTKKTPQDTIHQARRDLLVSASGLLEIIVSAMLFTAQFSQRATLAPKIFRFALRAGWRTDAPSSEVFL